MHRAIYLLTLFAVGSCLRVNFPEEQKCFAGDCVKLMDDIHHDPEQPITFRNLPQVSKGLKSIYCENGAGSCRLSYFGDGDSKHKHGLSDSPTFYDVANKTGTDKVTHASYADLYQRYLGNMSSSEGSRFVFVEIGFAKGMSARAWNEWLGRAEVHEFEKNCDQDWNKEFTAPAVLNLKDGDKHRDLGYCKLHCGDGTTVAFINEALAGVEDPFVVIDDGGHGPDEMKDSFKNWWPRIQPGGLFFMEDLEQSYAVSNGFVESVVKKIVPDVLDSNPSLMSEGIESFECMQAICVFRKKK